MLCMHGLQSLALHRASPESEGPSGSSPAQSPRPSPTPDQGFTDVAQHHLAAVVGQTLKAEGAADIAMWQPIITQLALDAAYAVLPSALAAFGVSDPRFYIKVCNLLPQTWLLLSIHVWVPHGTLLYFNQCINTNYLQLVCSWLRSKSSQLS